MAEGYRYRTALAGLGLKARSCALGSHATASIVNLEERPRLAQINLRGDAGSQAFSRAVAKGLGCGLPTVPNTSSAGDRATVLWLGPDEWLVVGRSAERQSLFEQLDAAGRGRHASVSDVSDARTVIRLAGTSARAVLAKGCSLDLHPGVFEPGSCAQSTLASCQMILHQIADEPAFDIYVGRSFALYAWQWLSDAAREFGAGRVEPD